MQTHRRPRHERRIAQVLAIDKLHQLVQARHIERALDLVHLVVAHRRAAVRVVVQLLFGDEHLEHGRIHAGRNLQPHGLGPLPGPQPRLDRPQHVVGLLLQQVDVHVAREPERGVVDDRVAAEQLRQPAGDQVFQQHEVLLVVRLRRTRTAATPAAPARRRTTAAARCPLTRSSIAARYSPRL